MHNIVYLIIDYNNYRNTKLANENSIKSSSSLFCFPGQGCIAC